MVTRRRFLHDSLLASAGRSLLPAYAQLADFASALQAKGLTEGEVAQVVGGNMQRVLKQVVG